MPTTIPLRGDRIHTPAGRLYIVTRRYKRRWVGATALRGGKYRKFSEARLTYNSHTKVFVYA